MEKNNINLDDYERITEGEWRCLENEKTFRFISDFANDEFKTLYFKKKDKFPKVFKDVEREIEVGLDGDIIIRDLINDKVICFIESIPLLEEAIKKSKEIRNKKINAIEHGEIGNN